MKIIIADDHPIVRQGLRAVLSAATDIDILAEATSGAEAVALADRLRPDVITMDLRFPTGMSGVEAVTALRALDYPPAVLVLTNYDTDADILSAINAGAQGYLLKDAPPTDIVDAVRRAATGDTVVAPTVATRLFHKLREPVVTLTPREAEVLACLDRGMSNRDIGAELFLSQPTVKSHLAGLYTKLGVSSRTAALAKARDLGLL